MSQAESIRFALNHMAAPQLPVERFFALAKSLGITEVEIRNDIASQAILDGTPAAQVKAAAQAAGVTLISINALQRFNDWTPEREREAIALADYARDCGARALVLVPVNDGSGRGDDVRQANVETALRGLLPILRERGLIGLVECLGFEACSLRSKREAAEAIDAVGGGDVLQLTHDTFHHHLAGEPELFPEITGLVHISGVSDQDVAVSAMRDGHRGLVDADDRVDNIEQIKLLRLEGYAGPYSFEPFAEELRQLSDPAGALRQSMDFIIAQLD